MSSSVLSPHQLYQHGEADRTQLFSGADCAGRPADGAGRRDPGRWAVGKGQKDRAEGHPLRWRPLAARNCRRSRFPARAWNTPRLILPRPSRIKALLVLRFVVGQEAATGSVDGVRREIGPRARLLVLRESYLAPKGPKQISPCDALG